MRTVKIVTSGELNAELKKRVEDFFTKRLRGEKPSFCYETDPDILGGIKVVDGDNIYDGTVLTQLERMKRSLL